jgi:hypothetical protein
LLSHAGTGGGSSFHRNGDAGLFRPAIVLGGGELCFDLVQMGDLGAGWYRMPERAAPSARAKYDID